MTRASRALGDAHAYRDDLFEAYPRWKRSIAGHQGDTVQVFLKHAISRLDDVVYASDQVGR